jgi:hypothetical protein
MARKIQRPRNRRAPAQHEDAALAEFLRKMRARFPQRVAPAPKRKADPEVHKPPSLAGAEQDLFRAEMCHRIQTVLCREPGRCDDSRCRRAKRCYELAAIELLLAQARARVAAEQAKWNES